jgi:hypothetical protein
MRQDAIACNCRWTLSSVMCNTPVEVQFTSAGCLNYPCRTPERVTTQDVIAVLELPQSGRRTGSYKRLAAVMVRLGWAPIRIRQGRFRGEIRGYGRDARGRT